MNYDELFIFEEITDGYELVRYRGRSVYKLEIPAQHKGKPVLRIGSGAFKREYGFEELFIPPEVKVIGDEAFKYCTDLCAVEFSEGLTEIGRSAFEKCENNLISVTFPKSLKRVGSYAFYECWSLERAVFLGSDTLLGESVFYRCLKLPADIQLMSILGSCDITLPLQNWRYPRIAEGLRRRAAVETDPLLREDVFEVAVKNGCFQSADIDDLSGIFGAAIESGLQNFLRIGYEGGLLADGELIDRLADISAKKGNTELTAWLLDYKNKSIGFTGTKYEL